MNYKGEREGNIPPGTYLIDREKLLIDDVDNGHPHHYHHQHPNYHQQQYLQDHEYGGSEYFRAIVEGGGDMNESVKSYGLGMGGSFGGSLGRMGSLQRVGSVEGMEGDGISTQGGYLPYVEGSERSISPPLSSSFLPSQPPTLHRVNTLELKRLARLESKRGQKLLLKQQSERLLSERLLSERLQSEKDAGEVHVLEKIDSDQDMDIIETGLGLEAGLGLGFTTGVESRVKFQQSSSPSSTQTQSQTQIQTQLSRNSPILDIDPHALSQLKQQLSVRKQTGGMEE